MPSSLIIVKSRIGRGVGGKICCWKLSTIFDKPFLEIEIPQFLYATFDNCLFSGGDPPLPFKNILAAPLSLAPPPPMKFIFPRMYCAKNATGMNTINKETMEVNLNDTVSVWLFKGHMVG